jgi:hypothetical protein
VICTVYDTLLGRSKYDICWACGMVEIKTVQKSSYKKTWEKRVHLYDLIVDG